MPLPFNEFVLAEPNRKTEQYDHQTDYADFTYLPDGRLIAVFTEGDVWVAIESRRT